MMQILLQFTQNGPNCQLRIYKTGTGAYELQIKHPSNYRGSIVDMLVNATNGGTVTVCDSDVTAGTTTGGTEYLVQAPNDSGEGHYKQVFSNIDVTNDIHVADSGKLRMGNATDGDLRIEHNGTNSTVDNYVGDLLLRQQANDKDIILQSDNGSGGLADYVRLDGSTGNLNLYNYGNSTEHNFNRCKCYRRY